MSILCTCIYYASRGGPGIVYRDSGGRIFADDWVVTTVGAKRYGLTAPSLCVHNVSGPTTILPSEA